MRNQDIIDDAHWAIEAKRINREVDAHRAETRKMIERHRTSPKRADYPNRQQYRAAVSQHRKGRS